MMSFQRRLQALLAASLLCCTPVAYGQKTIVETAVEAGSFKTLVAAVQIAGLVETLSGEGPFTVLAPTDEAFAALPPGTVESLLKPENKAQLVDILTYHVIPGRVPASTVVTLAGAPTVQGQRVDIAASDAGVTLDDASVVQTDIQCSNGIIHVLDSVLLPSTQTIPEVASGAGQFNTLLAAASAAGLVDVLSGEGPLTVFAPTDDAFSALPRGTVAELIKPENQSKLADILKYHVVAGRVYSDDALGLSEAATVAGSTVTITPTDGGANINDARLLTTDIDASNGVIHVIDRVLLPTASPQTAMKPSVASQRAVAMDTLHSAIQAGVPVFNSGHHGQCASMYMAALETVGAMSGTGLSTQTQMEIQQTLQSCRQMTSVTDRAWALRRQMDVLIQQM